MNIVNIILQLIGGAAGGNGISALLKDSKLSPILSTIVGLIGGFAGGQLAGLIPGVDAANLDFGSIIASLIGGGVGGGALTAIVGVIKQAISKNT